MVTLETTLCPIGIPGEIFFPETVTAWACLRAPISESIVFMAYHSDEGVKITLHHGKGIGRVLDADSTLRENRVEEANIGSVFDPVAVLALYYEWKEKHEKLSLNADQS